MLISFKIAFALLGFSAVVTEIATLIERDRFIAFNFLSYFTIQSNVLALTVLILSAIALASNRRSRKLNLIRGAATLYMVITGIIFAVLLAGVEGAILTAVPWDNIVLHYIMPLALLVDWFVDKPNKSIVLKESLVWLVYPVAYIFYTLIRGHFIGWYPYPFLDPNNKGYAGVLVTALCIAALTAVLLYMLVKSTRHKPAH